MTGASTPTDPFLGGETRTTGATSPQELGIPWGPIGELVYNRSYRRVKPDGSPETWPDTVERVIKGNLGLVPPRYHETGESDALTNLFLNFAALPGGRHLWMSGVRSRQFLFNCHVAGWDPANPASHFRFLFDQLMQGGGVGANYSNRYVGRIPATTHPVDLHLLCNLAHPDAGELTHMLSKDFDLAWDGVTTVDDSREGWCDALDFVLNSAWSNSSQPIVLDMSRVRPRGSPLRTFGGTAAGPMPLAQLLVSVAELLNNRQSQHLSSLDVMQIDHYIAETVVAGNIHRSARMAIKSWSDSDIIDFIQAKASDPLAHWSANLSVEIDDQFLKDAHEPDSLARRLLDAIIDHMLTNGEPGIWNRSRSSIGELRDVVATNPCGEIALEEWENCNLGHVNLGAFADNIEGALEAHRLMTRFLLRATFAQVESIEQREVLQRNRRIGVGHFGFQNWVVEQGIRYSDSYKSDRVAALLRRFYDVVRTEARRYAFELRIPEPIKVTTVAPTGTIAKLAGSTEGIQPVYSRHFRRRIRFATDDPLVRHLDAASYAIEQDLYSPGGLVAVVPVKDLLYSSMEDKLGTKEATRLVEAADEVSLEDYLRILSMYQSNYADNAVSATINIPADAYSQGDIRESLLDWLPKLKGVTIMVDGSRPQAPYERISDEEYRKGGATIIDSAPSTCRGGVCLVGNEKGAE